jgi:hypothetical protein
MISLLSGKDVWIPVCSGVKAMLVFYERIKSRLVHEKAFVV